MAKTYRLKRRSGLSKAQASAVAKIARKQITKVSELKYTDSEFDGSEIISTATVTKLSMPAQGDTMVTRDGDSIYIKSLRLHDYLQADASYANLVRVIFVQWLEDDAVAAPVLTDILEDGASGTDALTSFYKMHNTKKFKVLHDSRRSLTYLADGKPYVVRNVDLGKNLRMRKIKFNSGAVTGVGMIYMLVIGNQIATRGALHYGHTRLRFLDN